MLLQGYGKGSFDLDFKGKTCFCRDMEKALLIWIIREKPCFCRDMEKVLLIWILREKPCFCKDIEKAVMHHSVGGDELRQSAFARILKKR